MGFIANIWYVVFLSLIALGHSVMTGSGIFNDSNNLSSSPPGELDDKVTGGGGVAKRTPKVEVPQLGKQGKQFNFDSKKVINKNGQGHMEINPPSSQLRFRGIDSDDLKEFAVFVDSPDPEDTSTEGTEHEEPSLNNNNDGISVDYDSTNETSMKHVFFNKYKNGTVIHNIRIAVEHPQNLGRKLHTKIEEQKNVSIKENNVKTTQFIKSTTSVHGNCVNSSCSEQITNGKTDNLTATTPSSTRGIITHNTTTFKSSSLNVTCSPTISDTVAEHLTPSRKCSNINVINLDMPNTENCITRCLRSCTLTKKGSSIETFDNKPISAVPKGTDVEVNTKMKSEGSSIYKTFHSKSTSAVPIGSDVELNTKTTSGGSSVDKAFHNKSTSAVPIGTDVEHNTKMTSEGSSIDKTFHNQSSSGVPNGTDAEHNNKMIHVAINTAVSNSSPTHLERSKIDALLKLQVPIGVTIKHDSLDKSALKTSDVPFVLKDICLTDACVMKAAEFLKRMNASADPCKNFYEFACGSFLKHQAPNNELVWSVYEEISSDIVRKMISVLSEPLKVSEPIHIKEMKLFFGKCMKTTSRTLLKEALQELGGWPAPHNLSWKIPSINWLDIAFNWTHHPFMEHNFVYLNFHIHNETDKWFLNLDLPVFVKLALIKNSSEILNAIKDDTFTVAHSLGVDNNTVVESTEVLNLFMEYAIRYANMSRMNREEAFLTLGELKKQFPYITLLKALPSLLETSVRIDDNELIHVADMAYLRKINTLIRDTPVKTQIASLVISALKNMYNLVTGAEGISTARYCTKLAWRLYPNIIGSIYTTNFLDDSTVKGVFEILSNMKIRLEKTLKGSSLNEETKLKAAKFLKSLLLIVTNLEDRGFHRTGLTELVIRDSTFSSWVKAGIWNFKRDIYAFLHQNFNISLPYVVGTYPGNDYTVNAFYIRSHLVIPFSVLHEKIYNDALPSYVNYAGVGIVLGHEITHGLVNEPLSMNSSKWYLTEEQCLIDQFSDFKERYLGLSIDGNRTKDENIADLGGFRQAYLAYTDWATHHRELRLPGLQRFNGRQMFWLTAASNWCQVSSGEAMTLIQQTPDAKYAPPENRINGQLANLPEFSRDFHCPSNSPMNPKEKCSLW